MLTRQHPTNLAPELSSFVGREDALGEIARAFKDGARLVTIFGAPGCAVSSIERSCSSLSSGSAPAQKPCGNTLSDFVTIYR